MSSKLCLISRFVIALQRNNFYEHSTIFTRMFLNSASGESLPIISCVEAPVQMTDDFMAKHQFLIVDSLIYPVIF